MLADEISTVLAEVRQARDLARAQAQLALAQVEDGEDGMFYAVRARSAAARAFGGYEQLERAYVYEAHAARAAWREARRWADDAERAVEGGKNEDDYQGRFEDAMHERREAQEER